MSKKIGSNWAHESLEDEMGLFYTNITLFTVDIEKLKSALNEQNRSAYVSPKAGDFIVVYDRETENQDTQVLMLLTKTLTSRLKCKGLAALVHDSDLFLYWLYDNGKLVDSYNSLPDYFDPDVEGPTPQGGDAARLCTAFGKPGAISEVKLIFKTVVRSNVDFDAEESLQGEDIHAVLVKALGMPSFSAYTGYDTIENDALPNGFERDSFIKI